jgi:hypothetical protein
MSSSAYAPSSSAAPWGTQGVSIIDGKITKTPSSDSCIPSIPTGNNPLYGTCSEVSYISIRVPFREKDTKYIINKTHEPVYVVKIVDNKFTPNSVSESNIPFHQELIFTSNTRTCALNENGVPNNYCDLQYWQCNSYGPGDAMPGESGTSGSCEVP